MILFGDMAKDGKYNFLRNSSFSEFIGVGMLPGVWKLLKNAHAH